MKYRIYSSTGSSLGSDEYLGYSEVGILPEGRWDELEASKEEYGTVVTITPALFEAVAGPAP